MGEASEAKTTSVVIISSSDPQTSHPLKLDQIIGIELGFERDSAAKRKKPFTRSEMMHLITPYAEMLDKEKIGYKINSDEKGRIFFYGDAARLEENFQLFIQQLPQGVKADSFKVRGFSTTEQIQAEMIEDIERTITQIYEARMDVAEKVSVENKQLKAKIDEITIEAASEKRRLEGEILRGGNIIQSHFETISGLKARLNTINLSYEELIENNRKYESELAILRPKAERTDIAETRNQDLEARLEESRDNNTALLAEKQELSLQIASLKEEIEKARSEAAKYDPEQEKELATLRIQIQTLQGLVTSAMQNGGIKNPEKETQNPVAIPRIESGRSYSARPIIAKSRGHWLYTSIEASRYGSVKEMIRAVGGISASELYFVAVNGFSVESQKVSAKHVSEILIASGIDYANAEFLENLDRKFPNEKTILELDANERNLNWAPLLKQRILRLGFDGIIDFGDTTKAYSAANIYRLQKTGCSRKDSYASVENILFISGSDIRRKNLK